MLTKSTAVRQWRHGHQSRSDVGRNKFPVSLVNPGSGVQKFIFLRSIAVDDE